MRQFLSLLFFVLVCHQVINAEHLIANNHQEDLSEYSPDYLVSPDTIYAGVFSNSTTVFCPDTLEIQPPGIAEITPVSIETSSTYAADSANPACIEYQAASDLGTDVLLVSICNETLPAWCDTTYMVITVTPAPPTTQTDTITEMAYINVNTSFCADISEIPNPGTVDITFISQESSSIPTISVTSDQCIDYSVAGMGTDSLLLVVCDQSNTDWCDTTVFVINIVTPPIPTANDDNVNVQENETTILDLLANDNGLGNISTNVVTLPEHGTASFDTDTHLLSYTPDNNFCGVDSLEYNLCNGECVVAWVYITVICDDVEGEYKVFNSFSPNGDGINDHMSVLGIGDPEMYRLRVYSRWGIQVYDSKTNNDSYSWDGTWNGKDLPDGTYYYTFELPTGTIDKGFVQIHR